MTIFGLIILAFICILIPDIMGKLIWGSNGNYTKNTISGVLIMLSLYCFISISFAVLRTKLVFATIAWCICCLIIVVISLKRYGYKWILRTTHELSFDKYSVISYTLILIQLFFVTFLRHQDIDDSWYVGTAVTDWYTNTLDMYNPYTGSLTAPHISMDYFLARWPDLFATLAQLTGIHPTILMHTVFPPLLILFAFLVYYFIGYIFWPDNKSKQHIFVILISVFNMFGQFSNRSASSFLLLRIWQGKAVMIAILLPLIFALCIKYCEDSATSNWINLLLACAATCFVSSMGLILSGIVVGCNAIIYAIRKKSISRLFKLGLVLIPNVIIGIIYVIFTYR